MVSSWIDRHQNTASSPLDVYLTIKEAMDDRAAPVTAVSDAVLSSALDPVGYTRRHA